jgi:hypothetical protein
VTDHYVWAHGEELILRHGLSNAAQVIVIFPFFEEANRLRQILVAVMRGLAEAGIGAALPDLPGTGESLVAIENITLEDWRAALRSAAAAIRVPGQPLVVASFRSGALIDDAAGADAIWRCAPEPGQRLVRDLMRTRLTGATEQEAEDMVHVAGHVVRQSLLDTLSATIPAPLPYVRTARLETDAAETDVRLAGSPVWRRSEPGDDPALRRSILDDLIPWVKQCAAS